MDLVGVISAEADPPGLDRQRWLALIAEHEALVALDDDGAADIVLAGAVCGRMHWSRSDAHELDVHGELAQVADLAWNVAQALGGRFVTLQEMLSC